MMTTTNIDKTFDGPTKCTTMPNYLVRLGPTAVDHVSIYVLLHMRLTVIHQLIICKCLLVAKTVVL